MALYSEEELLGSLNDLYAERDRLKQSLSDVEERVAAIELDLRSVREEILDGFLHEELDPKLISFTLSSTPEEIYVSLSPQAGGEAEYAKMTSKINWADFTNLPVILLLSYLGKGMPWRSGGAFV